MEETKPPVAPKQAAPHAQEPEGADASADEAESSTEHAEQASDAASLDEIEPHTLHENETEAEDAAESEAESAALEVLSGAVPNWPFVLYVVVWLAAAAYGVWRFLQVPVGQAIFDNSLYVTSIMAGIGLLALGPVVLLVVWLVTFIKRGGRGWSLFVSALVKGAFVTLLGALIWMGALMLIDFLRVGRLL